MIELISNKIVLDGNYEIREYYTDNGIVRTFCSDGQIQSAEYIDKEKRDFLVLNYLTFFNIPFDLNPNGKDCLMLGGGTLTYPSYFLRNFFDKKIDVVEIDKYCIDIAQKYFFIAETLKKYGLNRERINIIIEDAVNYVEICNKKYDYILIDLFKGKNPLKGIYKKDSLLNIKNLLNKGGIIVANYIMFKENSYKEDIENLINLSKYYKIITDKENYDFQNKFGNVFVILSDNEIVIQNKYNYIELDKDVI